MEMTAPKFIYSAKSIATNTFECVGEGISSYFKEGFYQLWHNNPIAKLKRNWPSYTKEDKKEVIKLVVKTTAIILVVGAASYVLGPGISMFKGMTSKAVSAFLTKNLPWSQVFGGFIKNTSKLIANIVEILTKIIVGGVACVMTYMSGKSSLKSIKDNSHNDKRYAKNKGSITFIDGVEKETHQYVIDNGRTILLDNNSVANKITFAGAFFIAAQAICSMLF